MLFLLHLCSESTQDYRIMQNHLRRSHASRVGWTRHAETSTLLKQALSSRPGPYPFAQHAKPITHPRVSEVRGRKEILSVDYSQVKICLVTAALGSPVQELTCLIPSLDPYDVIPMDIDWIIST